MLINISNHPSNQWPDNQIRTAQKEFGEVVDIQFPNIKPEFSEIEIDDLADIYADKIVSLRNSDRDFAVHIMGEMTFSFALIQRLKAINIKCVASTSERLVELREDGSKIVSFQFERFRSY